MPIDELLGKKIEDYNYAELRAYAKENGLDTTGKTEVLKARCLAHFNGNNGVNNEVKTEIKATVEDKLFGNAPKTEKIGNTDYENPERLYRVYNLKLNNGFVTVRGDVVESFIGTKNKEARKSLKNGKKAVITYDADKKEEYRIEVV